MEGWSERELIVDVLRTFGRSDSVVDLLRLLPYIRPPSHLDQYEGYGEITSINYLRNRGHAYGRLTGDTCSSRGL